MSPSHQCAHEELSQQEEFFSPAAAAGVFADSVFPLGLTMQHSRPISDAGDGGTAGSLLTAS